MHSTRNHPLHITAMLKAKCSCWKHVCPDECENTQIMFKWLMSITVLERVCFAPYVSLSLCGCIRTDIPSITSFCTSDSPVRGQICAGWSKTGFARLQYWCTIVQMSSSWSFQIQRCPGFPHSCRSLRHFKRKKRGQTNLFFYVMEQANPQQPY